MKIFFTCILVIIAMANCSTPNKDKNASGKDASINNLTEIYWKLTELNGKAVSSYPAQNKEPYILLKKEGSIVEGTGGCNGIGGKFVLDRENKITFSQMMSTKMACPDMTLETDFHGALEKVKAYDSNGKVLTLLDEVGDPIAKFEASTRK